MRILFVAPGPLGDTVLSSVLLRDLQARHPGAEYTIACGPISEGLFQHMPGLRRVIVMRKHRLKALSILHWLRLWLAVVGTRWDLVVDVRGSGLGWFLWRGRLALRRRGAAGHKTAQHGAILGLVPPLLPIVWTGEAERRAAAARMPAGRKAVVLAPTAASSDKIWPAARFVELAAGLRAGPLPGAAVFVLAGPGAREHGLAEAVRGAVPGAVALYGLSLPEAIACLERCDLFVGNDSGPMHLAAAAGARTLGLFGPTSVADYAPAGPQAAAVVSPDGTMAGLSVGRVLGAVVGK